MTRPAIYTKWLEGNVSAEFTDIAADPNSRLRSSNLHPIFAWSGDNNYSISAFADSYYWSIYTASGGTVQYSNTERGVRLTTGAGAGANASITADKSVFDFASNASVVKFSIYFGASASVTLSVGISTASMVPQSSFNVDKLDGTGVSGKTIDPTVMQHCMIDYGSYKGDIRFFFYIDGAYRLAHIIKTMGTVNTNPKPSKLKPFRVDSYCDGTNTFRRAGCFDGSGGTYEGFFVEVSTAAAANIIRLYSCSVESESSSSHVPGSFIVNSIDTFNTGKNVTTTQVPLLAIRPRATYSGISNYGLIQPTSLTGIMAGNNFVTVRIIINPTLTGSSFVTINAESRVEYDVSSTSYTGGFQVFSTPLTNVSSTVDLASILNNVLLSCGNSTTPRQNILLVTGQAFTGNKDVYVGLSWRETY